MAYLLPFLLVACKCSHRGYFIKPSWANKEANPDTETLSSRKDITSHYLFKGNFISANNVILF